MSELHITLLCIFRFFFSVSFNKIPKIDFDLNFLLKKSLLQRKRELKWKALDEM